MVHVSSVNNLAILQETVQTIRITEATLKPEEAVMEDGETVQENLTTRKEIRNAYALCFKSLSLHYCINKLKC